jgi:ferritin-like metal-binding protein YciE
LALFFDDASIVYLKKLFIMAKNTRTASTKKSAASAATQDDHSLLHDLFLDELKDIYWAEKHLTKALPKFRKATTNQELADAFENHLVQTEEQIARLEEVFELMDTPARAKKCEGMDGLVREGQQMIEETPKGTSTRDAALIISAQKVEHYEISAYGSLVQLAKTIGRTDVADILAETLAEEKETDQLLTELAISSINIEAESEDEEDEE